MGKTDINEEAELRKQKNEEIKDYGQTVLDSNESEKRIQLLSIIGEIEGHETINNSKTTKYDHVLPKLAEFEDDKNLHGLLVLLQTCGGDVESGLAIAEMINSISKPTVSIVIGGGHSIGVPLATSADYSFITPSATMIVHPIRMNGFIIGVEQTFEYFKKMQDRIDDFIVRTSHISHEALRSYMTQNGDLLNDVGTILIGKEAVECKLIDEVGGISEALKKLNSLINDNNNR